MINKKIFVIPLVVTFLSINPAQAERSKAFGEYVVNYNALTTDFIQPKTASENKIKRSKNRGMVTIAIQRKAEANKALGKPVTAKVTGYAKNLNGQTRNLSFNLIKEGSAIYYIDDFSVTHQEVVDFVLQIKPDGENKSYSLKFRQQFFTK
ncbi:MAG: DUF4426 domain-containing protein [Gammaproteobacteria bacterium]